MVSQKNGSTERTARRIEQQATQVMNVVSGRAIEVSPDLTVANVISRVSGVSVERNTNGDGQYAILRGMDKRYNYTLVNGVKYQALITNTVMYRLIFSLQTCYRDWKFIKPLLQTWKAMLLAALLTW
ncbi:TonB-dependent receptor plug domain-containing protein [Mucilaginibacter sp. UC70_90]